MIYHYSIYRNSTLLAGNIDEIWDSGEFIIVDVNDFSVSIYNFNIIMSDGLGEIFKDKEIVKKAEGNNEIGGGGLSPLLL